MNDTTTIQVTTKQRERLRDVNGGSAKAAVGDLLDAYDSDTSADDGVDEQQIADALAEQLPKRLARELEGRLR